MKLTKTVNNYMYWGRLAVRCVQLPQLAL